MGHKGRFKCRKAVCYNILMSCLSFKLGMQGCALCSSSDYMPACAKRGEIQLKLNSSKIHCFKCLGPPIVMGCLFPENFFLLIVVAVLEDNFPSIRLSLSVGQSARLQISLN